MTSRVLQLRSLFALPALLVLAASGCASLNLAQTAKLDFDKAFPWEKGDDEIQVPVRVSVVWKDTVLNQRRQKGIRGFGGRVMFFNEKGTRPIKVSGDISVYAFDNTASQANPAPDRKFVFKQEELPRHYSKSGLGHSYSLWIPWDEVGGEPRKISLLIRFEDVTGAVVMSDPTPQTLPGIPRGMRVGKKSKSASGGVQQAAWQEEVQFTPGSGHNLSAPPKKMTTETIAVPRKFADKHLLDKPEYHVEPKTIPADGFSAEWPPFESSTEETSQKAGDESSSASSLNYYDPLSSSEPASGSASSGSVSSADRLRPGNPSGFTPTRPAQEFRARSKFSALQQQEKKASVKNQFARHSASLRARYEQHQLQAQTSGFEMPTRVGARSQRTPLASRSLLRKKGESTSPQTQWEWIAPESASTPVTAQ